MQQQKMVKEERSLGDLFSELMSETSTLVRQEVALAQVEMTNKATKAGKNIGYLVVGGAVGYAALLVVLAAVVMILGNFIPPRRPRRSEEHTSELQSRLHLVCRLLLEKKKNKRKKEFNTVNLNKT